MKYIYILFFFFSLFSCVENKKDLIKNVQTKNDSIFSKSADYEKSIYKNIIKLKKEKKFNFSNLIKLLPELTLPIESSDLQHFLKKSKLSENSDEIQYYSINNQEIKGYPIFITSSFDFSNIDNIDIVEISEIKQSIEDYSMKNRSIKKIERNLFPFYYLIPIYNYSQKDCIIIIYIYSLVVGDATFSGITLNSYDKDGKILNKNNIDITISIESELGALQIKSILSKEMLIQNKRLLEYSLDDDDDDKLILKTIKYQITKNGYNCIEPKKK